MSTLSIGAISINLGAKQLASKNPTLNLVPSLDSTCYYTSGFWREILLIIYKIADKVFNSDMIIKNRERVENLLKRSLSKKMKSVQFAHKTYQQHLDFLKKESLALEPKKEILLKSIKKITAWNQWIFPKLEKNMSKEYEEMVEINELQKIILLESLIKIPMPISSLLKLAKSSNIDEEDKKYLKPWIEEINSKLSSRYLSEYYLISPSTLHSALNKLVDYDLEARDNIESGLAKLGCSIFAKKDKIQEIFREEVFKNRTLVIDGKTVKLGEPLSQPDFEGNDQFHVYPLEEKSDQVVAIPITPTLICLQESDYQRSDSVFHFVEPLEVDHMGRFKICPKLIPLKDCWSLVPDKNKISLQIATLIQQALEKKQTPKNLSLKKIFIDKDYRIISSIPYCQSEFNYYELENFIFETTEKEPSYFVVVMNFLEKYLPEKFQKEGIEKYREGENIFQHTLFYRELIRRILNVIEYTRENVSLLANKMVQGLSNEETKRLINKAMNVAQLAKDQQNQIFQKVQQLHIDNRQALKDIGKIYLEEYEKGKYGAILPERLVSTVVERYQDEVVSHGRFYHPLVEKVVYIRSIINKENVAQLVKITTEGLKESEVLMLTEKGLELVQKIKKQLEEIYKAVLPEQHDNWNEKMVVKDIADIYFEEYRKGKYFFEVDEKLTTITMERFRKEAFPISFKDYSWKSSETKFNKDDQIMIDYFVSWIKNIIEKKQCPMNLEPQSVFFNEKNKIFCNNPLAKRYDYCDIESFLFKITEKSLPVFRAIMIRLKKEFNINGEVDKKLWPESSFYRTVVVNSLKMTIDKKMIDLILNELKLDLDHDPKELLTKNGIKLAQQAVEQKNIILQNLKTGNLEDSNNLSNENEIQDLVIITYKEVFKNGHYNSILPQQLVDSVIKTCQKKLKK